MTVSLVRLQHVAAVARTRSFTKAALDLRISQPALSRSVSAIEERYGIKIFERGRLGVSLTPGGIQVVDEINCLLRSYNDLDQNLRLHSQARRGAVSFGMSPQLSSLLLKDIAVQIFAANAELDVKVVVRSAPELMEALLCDNIEFFVCVDSTLESHPEVQVNQIGKCDVTFVVRAGHELTQRHSVSRADVASFPFVSAIPPERNSAAPGRTATFICDNYNVMRDLVMETDFVCAFARDFVVPDLQAGRLAEIAVSDAALAPRPAYIAKRAARAWSPLAKRIASLAQDRFKNRP